MYTHIRFDYILDVGVYDAVLVSQFLEEFSELAAKYGWQPTGMSYPMSSKDVKKHYEQQD